ncbi:fatty-acid--CoA ligase [Sphingomonas ginkgonis]|uniref:3-methylmercaptopropionyl-CoA ligase n=1 Tax=Sphingomonas ginkgonis TaxID=2315330 RepID=A0A3R9WR04_9SPHN|nr:long-chain fatty acid--CoA ligase [Sphingomonas ginkgonis]RST32209.1 fatty-acid--CoA ligase [Sphingomonas ginkgonis]
MQEWPLRLMRLVDHAERANARQEIVSSWPDGRVTRTSWGQVAHDARRMAQALQRLGMRKGDRIATLAMNHDRHLVGWYGAAGMGGVLHTLNPRLSDEHLVFIANHAEDRVLVYDRSFAPLVSRLKPFWRTIEHYICFDDEFPAWLDAETGDYAWVGGDERDPCGLCYTSGTTGEPKGVLYEHRSTVLHALAEIQPDCFDLSARSVVAPIVPMFHANAWGIPWAAPLTGCKLVLSADFDPGRIAELFREEAVTHSAAVPTVWLEMIKHVEETGASLGSLEKVTIGGSAAPRAMIDWFRRRGITVGHAWGMTELSPIGTLAGPPAEWDMMTDIEQLDYAARQGRTLFGVELRTVDDQGRELPRDGVSSGMLQARGAWVVQRYFKAPADAIDADGWFDTGDVATLHPDGSMQITDRAKDVIKSGGEWISSIELENAAVGCPGVAEAAAIGLPHPKWDERPLLCIVRQPESRLSEAQVRAHLVGRIPRWWLPDAIEFVDSLPHTATGKLSKKDLREQFADYVFPGAERMIGRA